MIPRWQRQFKEYLEALIIAVVLALLIRSSILQAFKIPSGSMLETLQIGDHLLVNKFMYGFKFPFTNWVLLDVDDPEHGDIIVFEFPKNPSQDYIKRVIGVPGDVIEIRDKVLYRNGEKQDESYVRFADPRVEKTTRDTFGPITVPENKYFVMGDNRDESYDSRWWGFVDREKILGKAWIIYWSWGGPDNVRLERIGRIVE